MLTDDTQLETISVSFQILMLISTYFVLTIQVRNNFHPKADQHILSCFTQYVKHLSMCDLTFRFFKTLCEVLRLTNLIKIRC